MSLTTLMMNIALTACNPHVPNNSNDPYINRTNSGLETEEEIESLLYEIVSKRQSEVTGAADQRLGQGDRGLRPATGTMGTGD